MSSIAARLGFGLAASVLVAALLLVWLSREAANETTRQYVEARLEDDAENLVAGLRFDPVGHPSVEARRIPPVYARSYSGHYFRIVVHDSEKSLRSRSLWDHELDVPPCEGSQPCVAEVAGPLEQGLVARSARYSVDGKSVTVTVAEEVSSLEAGLSSLERRLVIVVALLAMALLAVQTFVLRWSLVPLDRVRDELSALERGDVVELHRDVPRELVPLVDQINRLLRALQLRLTRGRNALGNFAHALKTPLTRARQTASADGSERSRDVERALVHLEEVIETQLKRARVAGGDVPTAAIPLIEVLDDVASVLKKVHADKALRLKIEVPAALVVRGDREDMLELFGNLLENAFKWARSMVRVSGSADDRTGFRVSIEDDGRVFR